jgi:hypothetical protein
MYCHYSGVWNVPYLTKVYLVKASLLHEELSNNDLFSSGTLDLDMAFCHNARNKVSVGKLWSNSPFHFGHKIMHDRPPSGAVV